MVYIVDPSDAYRNHVASLCSRLGYPSTTFRSAEDLLDESAHNSLNGCVVSEVDLPGINGLELLDRLRAKNVSMPFIILTAELDVKYAVTAFRNNVSSYLIKPAVERELAKAVETALQMSKSAGDSEH